MAEMPDLVAYQKRVEAKKEKAKDEKIEMPDLVAYQKRQEEKKTKGRFIKLEENTVAVGKNGSRLVRISDPVEQPKPYSTIKITKIGAPSESWSSNSGNIRITKIANDTPAAPKAETTPAPYNDILVQEARKYGASKARSERSSHQTMNRADAQRRAQAQVVSETVKDKKGGMLGGTVRGWLGGQVGAAESGLELLQTADWAASQEKANIDASRRNIENYTAKRDAAQTAEERTRWQQLIDRNERLIAINNEAYAKKTADVESTAGKLDDTRSRLKSDADYGIAKEKEGLGAVGRTAVDVGVAGGQMAMDALAGGLPSIASRVFGDSTQEAKEAFSTDATTAERMEGKTKALAYGAGSAAVSVATERLANIAAPFKRAFGGGVLDKALEGAAAKMGGNAAGKAALSFLSEGGEEMLEDVVQPILQSIYNGKSIGQNYSELELQDVLYDGLIGGILGLAGSGAEIAGNAITRGETAKFSPQEGAETTQVNGEGNLTPDAQNAAQGAQSALNENGLASLTEREKENLSSGKKNKVVSTFQDAVDFVRRALSDKTNVDRAYLGKVPASTAQMVLQETGVNIADYNAVIPSDAVRHMFKHHGDPLVEQARGQVHLTPDAVARIPEILTAPDKVSLSAKQDANGRPALIFEKQIGDNYITVQAVSNGTHSIQADTLYIRKRTPQDTVSNTETTSALNSNVRNVPPQEFSSADSVAQGRGTVNTQDMQAAREYAPERHIDPLMAAIFKGREVQTDAQTQKAPDILEREIRRIYGKQKAEDFPQRSTHSARRRNIKAARRDVSLMRCSTQSM